MDRVNRVSKHLALVGVAILVLSTIFMRLTIYKPMEICGTRMRVEGILDRLKEAGFVKVYGIEWRHRTYLIDAVHSKNGLERVVLDAKSGLFLR